ncbi:DUF1311 domain-containing protein [Clostridium perfringens]|nr:DUF1311 domain-containing protein [Clostridium perfringens]MDK0712697.1 DUF1311 domain-containing protein [Clostridium perfringens]
MKKGFKIGIIVIVLIILVSGGTFIFMKYMKTDKSLDKAIELINTKDYDKAVLALDMALDENKNNKKAVQLKDILEKYLDSKKELNEGKIKEASETLDSINKEYYDYSLLKQDIDQLKKDIDDKLKTNDEIGKKLENLRNKIKDNNLKEAKNLVDNLENENLNENQEKELGDLKSVLEAKEEKNKETSSNEVKNKKNSSNNATKEIYLKKLNEVEVASEAEGRLADSGVTADMVTATGNQYKLWDEALNDIYGQLKTQLSETQMKELQRKQIEWIKYKENNAKEKAADHGSMSSVIYNSVLTDLTKERCYYLVNNYMN